jgi:hypothetical protein
MNFDENFVPECYFDTVLVKTILNAKRINHQKGCSNVVKEMTESNKLKDDFAVGIIDKDKNELDYIKNNCEEKIRVNNLVLLKHRKKQHYFIQLSPAIEKWLLAAANEGEIDLVSFGLSYDLNKLRKKTKTMFAEEHDNLKSLCKALYNSKSASIATLSDWLNYLYKNNRNADINILKKDV